MRLQESGEMYLETIFVLSQRQNAVRAVDVGEYMGFSKPSVSRGIGILKAEGYVVSDENGFLKLTESGLCEARRIYERHELLTKLLTALGVNEDTASEDACKMEHVLSSETFEAIKRHAGGFGNEKA